MDTSDLKMYSMPKSKEAVQQLMSATSEELGQAAVQHAAKEKHLEQLVKKYKDRWEWCPLCRCAIITYTCCGNTTCNAGGCDKCDNTYDEVRELRANSMIPSIDQIEGAMELQRESDLHYYMRHADSRKEEPEWWNRIIKHCKESGVPLIIPTEEEQKNYIEPDMSNPANWE